MTFDLVDMRAKGLDRLSMLSYAEKAAGTNLMKGNKAYVLLGLANEAGEFAGKVKKLYRDKQGEMTDDVRESMIFELGDVLWYVANCGLEFNMLSSEDGDDELLVSVARRHWTEFIKGDGFSKESLLGELDAGKRR